MLQKKETIQSFPQKGVRKPAQLQSSQIMYLLPLPGFTLSWASYYGQYGAQ